MSGHSKWDTIKRQKGANDAKRGQLFTKLANAITIAVKQGGGNTDPGFNATLRFAIDKAKGANMPKDGIERAIQKGAGGAGGVELFEVMYEGFAQGGVGVLVEAVTDKKQRTVAEVKNVIEKNGGTMAGQGAVSYLFQKSGEVIASKNGKSADEILTIALENDVSDFEEEEEGALFYVEPAALQSAKEGLEKSGLAVEEASLVYKPLSRISVTSEIEEKVVQLIEKLEELDDVQKVYTNLEYSS
jgi:YebC/PmpR family DNA-binding regulatory protein